MSNSPQLTPIDIAGFALVAVILLGTLIVGLSILRKRARGAAFLSVRGLVTEKEPLPESLQSIRGTTFSRDQLTPSVVLPEKAHTHPASATHLDIINYHRESGNFPRPFAFALSASSPRSSPIDRSSFLPPPSRQSFVSSRYSVISTTSTISSVGTTARKVHQLFTPVLPDELLLTRVGERLTLVQSFDDGWCVVGRQCPNAASVPKSLFKSNTIPGSESDFELGVVPAWCFLKPVKGLRAERPIRSSSLGITVQMEGPAFTSRDEIISWSNF
jgi:hypothetical protein